MPNRILVLSLLCVVSATDTRAESRRITLADALELAERSPLALTLARDSDRADAEIRASGIWPNPEITVSREESLDAVDRFATFSIPFLLTNRLLLEKEAARRALRAVEARNRTAQVSLVRAGVREAFLELVAAQQRCAALEAGLSRLSVLVDTLRVREEKGESSGFDLLRAERERADLQADFELARGQLIRPREALAALLAIPAADLVAVGSLEAASALPSRADLANRVAFRGDVASLELETQSSDLRARAAARRAVPEPTLTAGAKTTSADGLSDTGPVVGVSFTLPLFDRGQGARAAFLAESALLRARREALLLEATAAVEAAYAESEARRQAEQSYASAGDPDDLIHISSAAFEGGAMRILELLDAHRTALQARLRAIELHAEARRAEINLDRALGEEVVR